MEVGFMISGTQLAEYLTGVGVIGMLVGFLIGQASMSSRFEDTDSSTDDNIFPTTFPEDVKETK